MILPILFVLGLAYIGSRIGGAASQAGVTIQVPVISGQPTVGQIRPTTRMMGSQKYRKLLKHRIATRGPVTRWLVDCACAEAFDNNDMGTVMALTRDFKHRRMKNASEKHASKKPAGPNPPSGGEEPSEEEQPSSQPNELEELGQSGLQSPIDGVENDDWMEFVTRLRTKSPGYKSDKYIGQYEQNKGRLKQLGLPDPSTPEQEYEALAADIAGHNRDSAELIARWSGDVVNINGTEHPICASGILGLLKSAGPEGAESWLRNPTDRTQFPKTTEAFLRTNGCF